MVDILSIFSSVFGTPDLPYNVGRSTVDPSDYRYPIDQNYPAYIQYRAKKVLPASISAANTLINEYKATVPDKLNGASSITGDAEPIDDTGSGARQLSQYEKQLLSAGYDADKAYTR